ncbi:hypothetical protein BDQ17DRAFT_1335873 [Cyathus striatus]|nr:hypothetical protein BDQ17DRAFT_1335873 [Cyathus striatus]
MMRHMNAIKRAAENNTWHSLINLMEADASDQINDRHTGAWEIMSRRRNMLECLSYTIQFIFFELQPHPTLHHPPWPVHAWDWYDLTVRCVFRWHIKKFAIVGQTNFFHVTQQLHWQLDQLHPAHPPIYILPIVGAVNPGKSMLIAEAINPSPGDLLSKVPLMLTKKWEEGRSSCSCRMKRRRLGLACVYTCVGGRGFKREGGGKACLVGEVFGKTCGGAGEVVY